VNTAAIVCTVKYEMRYCAVLVSVAVFIETFIACLLLGLLWPLFYNYKLKAIAIKRYNCIFVQEVF